MPLTSKRRFRWALALVLVSLFASGCSAATTLELPADFEARSEPSQAEDEPPAPEPTPVPTIDAAGVYGEIVNSVVFIDAGDGTGTGVVLDGGWILTNAHVVDRLGEVRIGRSDGVDLGLFPVLGVDWTFDLALVGPIDDSSLVPFERVPTADVSIGDTVMLIGFPDEPNLDPTPTLTSGIVSRRRGLAIGDISFIQTDATIAGGQSGGALVDADGNLVGISGFEFGDGEFGLALEGDVLWPRVDALFEFPGERVPLTNRLTSETVDIGPRSSYGFLYEVEGSGLAELQVIADEDLYIHVLTMGGSTYSDFEQPPDPFVVPREVAETSWFVDDLLEGGEELIGQFEPGLYQVIVGSFGEDAITTDISTTNIIIPYPDSDEGRELVPGDAREGVFDWQGDADTWRLPLSAGDQVRITTDAFGDTILAVRLDGETIAASDDDGNIGMFGTGSFVSFDAPADGTYTVEIGSFDESRYGYLVEAIVNG